MNKAFTKETESESDLEFDADAGVPGGINFITPAGARRLQEELERAARLRTELQRLIESGTAGAGSASGGETAGIQTRLREIERRRRFLGRRLAAAEIVDPVKAVSDHVLFGATVTIRDEHCAEKRYAIVGVDEADAARGRISWASPLARALMRAQAGDVVSLDTPQGSQEIEIVRVEYLPLEA